MPNPSPARLELEETMFMHYQERLMRGKFKSQMEKQWVRFHVNHHYHQMCFLQPFSLFVANSNLNLKNITLNSK